MAKRCRMTGQEEFESATQLHALPHFNLPLKLLYIEVEKPTQTAANNRPLSHSRSQKQTVEKINFACMKLLLLELPTH